jgi:predicted TIM-barrel fold metal-dependent hydrolase
MNLSPRVKRFLKRHKVQTIVDSHTHIYKNSEGKVKKRKTITMTYGRFPVERLLKIEQKLYAGFGIKARRVSFGLPNYAVNPQEHNRYVLAESKKDSTITPLALVTPKMTLAEIQRLVKHGFKGFKPYPEFSNKRVTSIFDYVPPNLIRVANQTGKPIILHISHEIPSSKIVLEIKKLSNLMPNSKIVLAHMGETFLNKSIQHKLYPEIKNLKNVFVDTSMCGYPQLFELAIRTLGPSRILYGSDAPFYLSHSTLIPYDGKRMRNTTQPHGRDFVEVTREKFQWVDPKIRETISREERAQIPRILEWQVQGLYSSLEKLYKQKRISSQQIRQILGGNALKIFR